MKNKNHIVSVSIHPTAIVESTNIGKDTRIWAFVHILPGAVIGQDCNICDHVFIENKVKIGDRTTIKSGVQLWDGITIEDDVFIGSDAMLVALAKVGKGAKTGAGAVVARDVPPG